MDTIDAWFAQFEVCDKISDLLVPTKKKKKTLPKKFSSELIDFW